MRDVSVLVPVYDERDNLEPLHRELREVFARDLPQVSWEVVFVDDGSRDGSDQRLRALAEADPEHVRVLELRRNYGQTAATDAALQHATGHVLVPIDADGQNDPADIPRLLAELARGADVVSGWRRRRQDKLLSRRVPSWLANRLIAWATGVPIHDFGCTLKAYRRDVLAGVRLYGEMHRYIPAYARRNGARVVELEVNHRPRTRGKSKYGLGRTFKVLFDLLTVSFLLGGYVSRPGHVFGGLGLAALATSLGLTGVVVWQKLLYPVGDPRHVFVHRNPLATLATLVLILGAGSIALGLLGELLARIYHASAGPPYAIAGGRNLPALVTPEQGRALPESLAALAPAGLQPPGARPGPSSLAGPAVEAQAANR